MENQFIKRPEYTVKATEKKAVIAKFIEMQVKQGNSIEEYMGKPLNWWNYGAVVKAIKEWEIDQLVAAGTTKERLEEEGKRLEEINKKMKGGK